MSLDPATLAAILGMTLATYLCRAGGYWLFRQIRPGRTMRAALAYLPGTLFVGYVAPGLWSGGPQAWAGGAMTVAAMVATGNVGVAIFAGTGAAWLVWLLR